jgi:hypothetical protein
MKIYKLTELIKGIPLNEFKKFGEFLRSPLHNKSEKVLLLYELINKHFENFQTKVIYRKSIAEYVYPGEPYNDQNIRTLLSNFSKLLEKFLIYEELENDALQQRLMLIKTLKERETLKNFEMKTKELLCTMGEEFNRDPEYYHKEFSLKELWVNYEGKNLEINLDNKYYELSDTTDLLFIVSKLRIINALLSRKYHTFGVKDAPGADIKLKFWGIDKALKYIEDNLDKIQKEHPIVYSEYLILVMMTNPEKTSYFYDLKKYVLKNTGKYNMNELGEVYYSLTNYCVNKVNIGERNFLKDLYDFYKEFEASHFYYNIKHIQYPDFLSIILNALYFKDILWAEYFYKNYKIKITPEFKKDTVNLAGGLISFHHKKYNEAIEILNKVGYRNSYFYLNSKVTLVKIYYELGEMNSLMSVVDAMRHYLKRHREVLMIQYERYLNFLNLITHLTKMSKNGKDAGALKKELKKFPNAIGADWLSEKVKEFK